MVAADNTRAGEQACRRWSRQFASKIWRSDKGIVGFGDLKGENRGVELGVIPAAKFHGFRELLAVHANFPGKQAGGLDPGFAILVYRGFVAARQSVKREAPIFI